MSEVLPSEAAIDTSSIVAKTPKPSATDVATGTVTSTETPKALYVHPNHHSTRGSGATATAAAANTGAWNSTGGNGNSAYNNSYTGTTQWGYKDTNYYNYGNNNTTANLNAITNKTTSTYHTSDHNNGWYNSNINTGTVTNTTSYNLNTNSISHENSGTYYASTNADGGTTTGAGTVNHSCDTSAAEEEALNNINHFQKLFTNNGVGSGHNLSKSTTSSKQASNNGYKNNNNHLPLGCLSSKDSDRSGGNFSTRGGNVGGNNNLNGYNHHHINSISHHTTKGGKGGNTNQQGTSKNGNGQKGTGKSVYRYVPGDWICPTCEDLQFRRNQNCRICGTLNPMVVAQELALAAGKSLSDLQCSESVQAAAISQAALSSTNAALQANGPGSAGGFMKGSGGPGGFKGGEGNYNSKGSKGGKGKGKSGNNSAHYNNLNNNYNINNSMSQNSPQQLQNQYQNVNNQQQLQQQQNSVQQQAQAAVAQALNQFAAASANANSGVTDPYSGANLNFDLTNAAAAAGAAAGLSALNSHLAGLPNGVPNLNLNDPNSIGQFNNMASLQNTAAASANLSNLACQLNLQQQFQNLNLNGPGSLNALTNNLSLNGALNGALTNPNLLNSLNLLTQAQAAASTVTPGTHPHGPHGPIPTTPGATFVNALAAAGPLSTSISVPAGFSGINMPTAVHGSTGTVNLNTNISTLMDPSSSADISVQSQVSQSFNNSVGSSSVQVGGFNVQ